MKYRTATILSEKTLDASGTEIIPLRVQDVMSRITLGYRAKRVAVAMSALVTENISKVELVDGSDVLFSMDGSEMGALNMYDRRLNSLVHQQYMQGNSMFVPLSIDFGRFLYDTELAFDPKRFNNPMLKVTYNETTFDANAVDSFLAVYADVFDEKVVSPIGFLMSKEHWKRTMPQNTYAYVDLPTDFPIRQMILRGYLKEYEPWYTISDARLDEDNEKRIPFDWDIEHYYRVMKGIWTPVIEGWVGTIWGNELYNLYTTPSDYLAIAAGITEDAGYVVSEGNQRGGFFKPKSDGETRSARGIVYGWLPFSCVQFPFGDQKDMDDWYDVTAKGSIRLRLKGGDHDPLGTGHVVLQQLRRY